MRAQLGDTKQDFLGNCYIEVRKVPMPTTTKSTNTYNALNKILLDNRKKKWNST